MNEEVNKFLNNLPTQDQKLVDIFEDKKVPEEGKKEEEKTTDEGDVRKNRRHRRLEEQLQKERESNIALNERLKILAEVENVKPNVELDERLIEIFGPTDEAKRIAQHFAQILNETKDNAKEEAIKEFNEQKEILKKEQLGYELLIDKQLELLEDKHNIDLTSDIPSVVKTRQEFLGLIQSLSPKDSDGIIKDYADFNSTFEIYQSIQKDSKKDNIRQKEIASKTMQKSNQGGKDYSQQITPGFRGWETDYNINN